MSSKYEESPGITATDWYVPLCDLTTAELRTASQHNFTCVRAVSRSLPVAHLKSESETWSLQLLHAWTARTWGKRAYAIVVLLWWLQGSLVCRRAQAGHGDKTQKSGSGIHAGIY